MNSTMELNLAAFSYAGAAIPLLVLIALSLAVHYEIGKRRLVVFRLEYNVAERFVRLLAEHDSRGQGVAADQETMA